MELSWTRSALEDLDSAAEYIAQDNPRVASAVASRMLEATEFLLRHPNLGRIGRVRGTRELVVSGTPFVVIYRVKVDELQVLRVLHHARKWPR